MTVVPGPDNQPPVLVCDHCGRTAPGQDGGNLDPRLVWPVLTEYGWAGSPFAAGPHECSSCTAGRAVRIVATGSVVESGRVVGYGPGAVAAGAGRGGGSERAHGRVLRVECRDGMAVVRLAVDLDVRIAEILRQALVTVGAVCSRVVLDLADVGLIDSAGLGALVRAHRALDRGGVTLCLAAPSWYLVAVLHTMGLGGAFGTYADSGGLPRGQPTRPPGARAPTASHPAVCVPGTEADQPCRPRPPTGGCVPSPSSGV
ncbi:STAS domain-containing protein [Plantactinospora sp. B5E13]|uniref:STAS domain-containing protein n=1 Tax=Plantactinospora sp. B5E13 TaxID=3153758 RepID=UPI00325E3083